jgi:hypothetical protein
MEIFYSYKTRRMKPADVNKDNVSFVWSNSMGGIYVQERYVQDRLYLTHCTEEVFTRTKRVSRRAAVCGIANLL